MFSSLIKKYKGLHLFVRFAVNILLLSAIWFGFYSFLRYSFFVNNFYEQASMHFTSFLLISSKFVLNLFGFETEIQGKIIKIANSPGVFLDKGCLARNLLGLYVGFILAYPGKIKHKLWAIPLGIIIINILNVLRIAGLAYLVLDYPEYVDINHHVIFKYTVYFFIFLMWYFWIKHFSASSKNNRFTKQPEANTL